MIEFEVNKILDIFKRERYNRDEKILFIKGKLLASKDNKIIKEACQLVLKKIEEEK